MATFHEKLLEKKEKEQLEKTAREKYEIDDNIPIVIKNETMGIKLARFIKNSICFLAKGIFYISVMMLTSIGLTVLINGTLRDIFIQFILNSI